MPIVNEPDSIETIIARITYARNKLEEREHEIVIELDKIREQITLLDRALDAATATPPPHAAMAGPSQTAAEKIDSRQTIKEV